MPPAQQQVVQNRIANVPLHFDALFRAAWQPHRLGTLTMPTLLMHGNSTRAPARKVADLLAEELPGAQRLEIAGAGHLGPITHAQRVNAAILAHLARHLTHDKLAVAA